MTGSTGQGATRRRVLTGAVLAGAGLAGGGGLSACGGKSPSPEPTSQAAVDPDRDLVRAAVAGKRTLLARYAALSARHPRLTTSLAGPRADHEGHLRTLAANPHAVPDDLAPDSDPEPSGLPGATATPGATADPGATAVPSAAAEPGAALRELAEAERAAAAARQAQCVAAQDAELARLLASIGGCEAAHGLLLADLAELSA